MAEAEELLLALEHLAHRGGRALRRSPLLEELHRRRVRAAVQRAAERGDRRDDRGGQVGARARDDARGERRRVHLVLGVQDHRDVEDARGALARALAGEHREEVLRVAERRRRARPARAPAGGGAGARSPSAACAISRVAAARPASRSVAPCPGSRTRASTRPCAPRPSARRRLRTRSIDVGDRVGQLALRELARERLERVGASGSSPCSSR